MSAKQALGRGLKALIPETPRARTGLAGEILQKAATYQFKTGIVGEFSLYGNQASRAVIIESNRVNRAILVNTVTDVIHQFAS